MDESYVAPGFHSDARGSQVSVYWHWWSRRKDLRHDTRGCAAALLGRPGLEPASAGVRSGEEGAGV